MPPRKSSEKTRKTLPLSNTCCVGRNAWCCLFVILHFCTRLDYYSGGATSVSQMQEALPVCHTDCLYLFLWSPYCTSLSSSKAGIANENITRVQSGGDVGEATQ
jgi:hypothetical protein